MFLDLADVLFLFLRCDKEVSDENRRCETVKEDVVSEIVKEDLGYVDGIVRLVFLLLWAVIM